MAASPLKPSEQIVVAMFPPAERWQQHAELKADISWNSIQAAADFGLRVCR